MPRNVSSLLFVVLFTFSSALYAQVTSTQDLAILDGGGAPGSLPVPMSVGVNAGFGNQIGAATQLGWDTDALGNFSVGLHNGACAGSTPSVNIDMIVIYLDTVAGGFQDTTMFNDVSSAPAAAASGLALPPTIAGSPITFAPGFLADYAIVIHNSDPLAAPAFPPSATLVQLVANGAHIVTPLPFANANFFGIGNCDFAAIPGAPLSSVGLVPGDSIDYVATVLNVVAGFRGDEWHGAIQPAGNPGVGAVALGQNDFNRFSSTFLKINELDSDNVGGDTMEFIEMIAPPGTDLTGGSFVRFNGSIDQAYGGEVPLTGFTTNALGLFVVGNTGVPNVGVVISASSIQNGPDGAALFISPPPFPNGTPVTSVNLIDALVYDTNDADDAGLLAVLTPGEAQINEGSVDSTLDSSSRCPDGSGGQRQTGTYIQTPPTPGELNSCAVCGDGVIGGTEVCDDGAANGTTVCGCQDDCNYGVVDTACVPAVAVDLCEEYLCDGAGTCASNLLANTVECRAAAGLCDVADFCDGVNTTCPDVLEPDTTECAAEQECVEATACDGVTVDCPAPTDKVDGTACGTNDGVACNGFDACETGVCTTFAAPDCDDQNVCTGDTCTEPLGVCDNAPIVDCCIDDQTCDDGNVCTTNVCDLGTNLCATTPIAGCCASDADCMDADVCTSDTCDVGTGICTNAPVADCCADASACDDGDMCTTDACNANVCENTAIAGCPAIGADMGNDSGSDSDTGVSDAGADGGLTRLPTKMEDDGCCRVVGGGNQPTGLLLLVLGWLVLRRRRKED